MDADKANSREGDLYLLMSDIKYEGRHSLYIFLWGMP